MSLYKRTANYSSLISGVKSNLADKPKLSNNYSIKKFTSATKGDKMSLTKKVNTRLNTTVSKQDRLTKNYSRGDINTAYKAVRTDSSAFSLQQRKTKAKKTKTTKVESKFQDTPIKTKSSVKKIDFRNGKRRNQSTGAEVAKISVSHEKIEVDRQKRTSALNAPSYAKRQSRERLDSSVKYISSKEKSKSNERAKPEKRREVACSSLLLKLESKLLGISSQEDSLVKNQKRFNVAA